MTSTAWHRDEEALAAGRHLSARENFLWRPVALVGFMGVGKSSVGRHLAGLLGRRFVDTDTDVEQRAGLTITELFAQGEKVFRDLELAAVQRALDHDPPQVIAPGGGAFAQSACAQLLLSRAVVVHLYTPWNVMLTLLDGLSRDRPLIRDREAWEAQDLFLARARSYRRAHLRVDIPRHGPVEAAEAVAVLLRHSSLTPSMLRES
jgi:shikimate kinase